ncbi:hypothetical protein N657DRAFT_718339 [Parathielavia appendiculata]|uniref:Zn(2)-C6 fungal-type domain-containing protein n=1 Tax=Parathielavia appendiculata TaxID=2587402 RepID=A0AAN6Z308_9PEZI|nr:hypothetical protein N657DRAFT_718339 [Parathielavia appendiculata]
MEQPMKPILGSVVAGRLKKGMVVERPCDLMQPTCTQCVKAGLKCTGHDTRRVFVVITPGCRQAGYRARAGARTLGITDPSLLARPEDERSIINLSREAFYPAGRPLPASAVRSYTCTWAETVRKIRHGGVERMFREPSTLYRKASCALSPPGNERQLAHEAPRPHHAGEHAGELALFITRTPAAHLDGDAHHMFADERMELHLTLSNSEWKTTPWAAIPKNFKDIPVDVLVDMRGLVQTYDKIQSCTEASEQATHDLGSLATRDPASATRHARPEESRQLPADPADLVTHVAQVHGMILFWTTSLVLDSIPRVVSGPQAKPPEPANPAQHVRRVVDAIPILLRSDAELYGQQSAAVPLEVALNYTTAFGSLSHESGELVEALKSLKEECSGSSAMAS